MLKITLRQLEYVTAVAEHGSLTLAADHLHVSQPALSVALSQVEAQIGHRLFARGKGARVMPTALAALFVDQAQQVLAAAARLQDPAALMGLRAGRLTIGVARDLAPVTLAPALRCLTQALPGVDLRHRVDDFEGLIAGLAAGELDMALTYDLGLDAGFDRVPLRRVRPWAFVATDHPLAQRGAVGLVDLADHPLILFDQVLSNRHMVKLFLDAGHRPTVVARVPDLELMRSLAANGQGVGISYLCPPGDQSYDGARVHALAITDPQAEEPIILALPGGQRDTAPMFDAIAALARALGG